jgi:HrpA-like RNA helicase
MGDEKNGSSSSRMVFATDGLLLTKIRNHTASKMEECSILLIDEVCWI